ncbi:TIGR04190 family B12-binding domain/radical SAM domain protein [Phosphitispora sp. TUW77]|uniref:TIGR04190 family B12-binding domain/radical SAM domain protein n=1 Tax=Phosphitispora sp. TUW77 TaxID=3152361 RepID=UPI003AB71F53
MLKLFKKDLIFLHAPSVYDFRKDTIMFGPISDVVPSSPTFEMYPVGITSIGETLEHNGFNVQIVNIAYQMLRNEDYDVEKVIAAMNPVAFGIDLHWLPHVHGSIELAKICKKYHPDIPVIFGGLSSSYYHEELISYPFVDFVVRGDSTEEPMLQLMKALRYELPFDKIPNLTWKTTDATPMINPLTHVPENIDYISIPCYSYVVRSVFKYANLHNTVPYLDWLKYPITALLTARGCTQNCSICGGSEFAYKRICNRDKPAYRSPQSLIEDIRLIQKLGQAPIFVLHDLRQAGPEYVNEFFSLLKKENVKNELIIELFWEADDEYFAKIADAVPKFSLEMTLETHIESIRKMNRKFSCSNEQVENTIASAFKYGCRKIDIFFMTGIPKQTYAQAVDSINYCRHLLEKFDGDKRLSLFIAPLAPFLDPGCLAFEFPEKYGYKKYCHTLEDHYHALTKPSWKHILSYETDSMTRDEIVRSTYEAALKLNALKHEYNLIDDDVYKQIEFRISSAQEVMDEIDKIMDIKDEGLKQDAMKKLKTKVEQINRHSICGKDELKWPITQRFGNIFSLASVFIRLLFVEVKLFFNRARLLLGQK